MLCSRLHLGCLFCVAALAPMPASTQTASDKAGILHTVDLQYEYFEQRNAAAYGGLFTTGGTFISMPGLKIDGRRDIIDANAKFFVYMNVDKTRML